MTFRELAFTRITPKFREKESFKSILQFLVDFYDGYETDKAIINDMRNFDTDYGIVLDELGKLYDVFPRPKIATTISGDNSIFALDTSMLDTVPLASLDDYGVRSLSNDEYRRLLKSLSRLTNFQGTLQEWEDVIADAAGANPVLTNRPSSFDIIILKDLTALDKYIIEFALSKNNLTVSKGFLGTTIGDEPFRLDSSPLDSTTFFKPW